MYDTSFFTIFRARRNGDGHAADFPRFTRTRPHPLDKFSDPMYHTSFFTIFRARRDGDGPAADFTHFHTLSRTRQG